MSAQVLTPGDVAARQLIDQILNQASPQLIGEAYQRGDWRTLCYASWPEFLAAEFGIQPQSHKPRLNVDHRQVYFIQPVNGGLIKIGVAANPHARLREIQHMSPVRLHIVGVIAGLGQAGEAELHTRFAAIRAWGEWFQPTPELTNYIRQLATPTPVGAR